MRRLDYRGAVVRGALQSRLSARRPPVGKPLESDVDDCGGQRGLAVPACVGERVFGRRLAPLFAVVALAPLVYAAFRYDAGQDTSATEGVCSEAEVRVAVDLEV
jgi:hypothetical protein